MLAGLKWGAIVGVAIYVIEVALGLIENALTAHTTADVTAHPVQLIPICLLYFGLLFSFSAAGFYTGRETGRAALGAVAGPVTLIVQYILARLYSPTPPTTTTAAPPQPGVDPVLKLLAMLVAPLLLIGIAASLGWLGGRPGAQRHAQRQPSAGPTGPSALPDLAPPRGSVESGSTIPDER
jgi:hypothetical protein